MVAYWPARSSSRSDVRRRVSAPSAHSYPTPGEPTMLVHEVLQRAAVAAAIGVFSAVAPAAAQSATAITAENVMHFKRIEPPPMVRWTVVFANREARASYLAATDAIKRGQLAKGGARL